MLLCSTLDTDSTNFYDEMNVSYFSLPAMRTVCCLLALGYIFISAVIIATSNRRRHLFVELPPR